MSLYFLLGTMSHEGQRMLHANPNLIVDAVIEVKTPGAVILGQYAVLGEFDFVMMAEADDNQAVARLSLEIGVRTGLHMETLPAIPIAILSDETAETRRTGLAAAPVGSGAPEEWRLPGAGGPPRDLPAK
jgi:uncharacterized protein with GYD domain